MSAKGFPAAAALVLGLALAASLALGAWLGRRTVVERFRGPIARFAASETLGAVAGDERASVALAYQDPARAEREMDGYVWSVPNVPTPFVGTMPAPGVHGGATIGADQFRHRGELRVPKPAGTFRIFLTGGSTAFGTGAPGDERTIGGLLEEALQRRAGEDGGRRYEVVTAANPGWSSTHERILVENRLSELEPDLVVSLSGNNDAHWGFLGFDVLWYRTYYDDLNARLLLSAYELGGETPERPRTLRGELPVDPSLVAHRLAKNLRLSACALEPTGARFVFALQPNLPSTAKPLTPRERAHLEEERLGAGCAAYFARCYDLLRAELGRLELPAFAFVDLTDAFDARPADEEVFLDSYHFGDRGNELLAQRLLAALEPFLAP